MPRNTSNSTGRWVERAATTGGGRTYRGQVPINWYASLVAVIIVGLLLIGYSRYEKTHQTVSSAGQPTKAQVWHSALGIDICGTVKPNLAASTNAGKVGFTTDGTGVITIAPKTSSETGKNATLGKFVSEYGHGLELSTSSLRYPGGPVLSNGDVCPKGTPDASKEGVVIVYSWPNFESKKGSETSGDPQDLLFANGQLITMAFLPATATVPQPPAKVKLDLINAVEASAQNAGGTTTLASPTTSIPIPTSTVPTTSSTAKSPAGTTK